MGVHLSNTSSSSDHSPISTDGSTFSTSDPLQRLSRQCSIRHVVHKNFLEPICDDCLLEELGLQPELGPILGGRDLQEGLHGEEWILESTVEINVEDSDDDRVVSSEHEDADDEAANADDEGETRGRSGRRRGLDINRDAVRISSNLSLEERRWPPPFREHLHGAEMEARTLASTVVKSQRENTHSRARWSRQPLKSLSNRRSYDRRHTSTSPSDEGSKNSLRRNSVPPLPKDHDHEPGAGAWHIENDLQLPSTTMLGIAKETSLDGEDEIGCLYETTHNPDIREDASYRSWSQHLNQDLQENLARQRNDSAAAVLTEATIQEHLPSPSSIHSSPQTTTALHSASWPLPTQPALNIPSSEFDTDNNPTTTPQPTAHAHTTSTSSSAGISTTSTFRTAPSTPSSPSSYPPHPTNTTATATATSPTPPGPGPLSLNPLATPLRISTPHRPALTSRTSSLRSPPASSPLLHSTPPLRQSPTGVFVCVHERWAFRGCGCEGPSWVRSCVCDDVDEEGGGENHAGGPAGEDGGGDGFEGKGAGRDGDGAGDGKGDRDGERDGCRATEPIVRTRWFFNRSCEGCDGAAAAWGTGTGPGT